MENRIVVQSKNLEIRSYMGMLVVRGLLPTNSLSLRLFHKKEKKIFRELIEPGAFDKALNQCQPAILLNHDHTKREKVISFKGSEVKRIGYQFEAQIVPSKELQKAVEYGNINGLSFGFKCGEQCWNKVKGTNIRTIKSFESILEISILSGKNNLPAYPSTKVIFGNNKGELDAQEIKSMKKTVVKLRHEQMKQRLKELRK